MRRQWLFIAVLTVILGLAQSGSLERTQARLITAEPDNSARVTDGLQEPQITLNRTAVPLLSATSAPIAAVISRTYTLDADFALGTSINVTYTAVHNQLQMVTQTITFPFIWVPASTRGTVVKINTATGQILGEYRTAPDGRANDPSRTTVDMKGNVWIGNRAEADAGLGSVVHIGLKENGQCVDRNGNGVIDTSTGLGDIKAWPNATSVSAADECIIHYVRVPGTNVRHLSVDKNNNVWVGGYSVKKFSLVDGATGTVLQTVGPFNCGGYGGLVDGNGIVWSTRGNNQVLRYDPATNVSACLSIPDTYGMGIDAQGNIWAATWGGQLYKLNPAGVVTSGFPKTLRANPGRGVAVDSLNNVWVVTSGANIVKRFDVNGNLLNSISLAGCVDAIGVAVDAANKIWVTCQTTNNAVRINPTTNTIDLSVSLGNGAGPYNYSDMTGQVALTRTDPQGSWTVIYDSAQAGTPWGTVSWNGGTPLSSTLVVRARSAETPAALNAASYFTVTNGVDIDGPNGRYLQVEVVFRPGTNAAIPILYDLTIQSAPPPCVITHDKFATPTVSVAGGAVNVTLAMRAVGACDAVGSPADVVLVLDRSGSMAGDKLSRAKLAANTFVSQTNLTVDQVGVASFASTGQGNLEQQLSRNRSSIQSAINGLQANGMTNIKEGLEQAETELLGGRHLVRNAAVVILLSDGMHNETAVGELAGTANRIKGEGIRIISIGLGADANADQLRAIASSAQDYYYAPTATDLASIYQRIAPTVRVAGRSMILTDTMSTLVTLVPGSIQSPVNPVVMGDQIVWNIAAVPVEPITLTYQVVLTTTPGNWPTNASAIATYIDAAGLPALLTFPVPHVTVPAVCETPAVQQIQPTWACVTQTTPVAISGHSFFTMTDFTAITGTFSVTPYLGLQPLALLSYSSAQISAILPAGVLPRGVYDFSVVNTCALTNTPPLGGSGVVTPVVTLLPPPKVFTGTLYNGFTLYAAPRILSIRPAEGYSDAPASITICGEGFVPGAEAFINTVTGTIPLENQAVYGDGCLAGTVPISLTPGLHTITVQGVCGQATGQYRVLAPELNDDLWSMNEELWIDPALCPSTAETIKVGLTVSRRGGKDPLQNVVVRFYEDLPNSPDHVIGDGTIPLMPPRVNPTERISGYSTSAVPWTPSRGAGEYVIYGVIDPANQVVEDIEANNIFSRTVRVLPGMPGRDQVAPRVDALTINNWPATVTDTVVYTRNVAVNTQSTDFAQPGVSPLGVASMNFVEYLFNSAVSKWVPVGSTGWLTFTPSLVATRAYSVTLSPVGGLRVIQAWAADAGGKISRYPAWAKVNYAPPCTYISRDGRHVYRQALNPGDTLRVEVVVCSGDADLYIWPSNWESGNPPYVSNLAGTATEFFEIQNVAVGGSYQIEVYGYSNARYSIQIEVQPAPVTALKHGSVPTRLRSAGVDPAKDQPTDPALPIDNLPAIMPGLPPDVPAPDVPVVEFSIYLPLMLRQ